MAGVAASPLTDAEQNDTRRFAGYPAYGADGTNASLFVFFERYRTLEYRMANLTDSEVATVRTYLTTLAGLEIAIPAAGDNLDTAQAAVWTRNANEVRDRDRLFDSWRRRLCGFLGVPVGPALSGAGMMAVVI